MRRYLSFLTIIVSFLTGTATFASADEMLYGRIASIDQETGRVIVETIPTLLQPAPKKIEIDLSTFDHDQWAELKQEDTIRAWINTSEESLVHGVRSFQAHHSTGQQQADPTGVRQRLSSQRTMGSGRSTGAPARSGGGGGRR